VGSLEIETGRAVFSLVRLITAQVLPTRNRAAQYIVIALFFNSSPP
jgi:hypothetical protein